MSVPSLFASSVSTKTSNGGPSYLKRNVNRQKVGSVLASVDHAIEGSQSDRTGTLSYGALKDGSERSRSDRSRTKSPRRSKSIENKGYRVRGVRKNKAQSMDPSAMGQTTDFKPDDNSVRSIRSVVKNSPRLVDSPTTPAWKARLRSTRSSKSPNSRTPTSIREMVQKNGGPNPFALKPPFAGEEGKERKKKEKKEKKEKKDKKKKKKKSKDKEKDKEEVKVVEASENFYQKSRNAPTEQTAVPIKKEVPVPISPRRSSQAPVKSNEDQIADMKLIELRKKVEEAKDRLKNIEQDTKQEIVDMEKNYADTKDAIKVRIMKCIHAQGKKNDERYAAYKSVVDAKQKEIDELRAGNTRLRNTLQKLPKQMADMVFSNQAMEEANKEIAGHIEGLTKFDKKLQADQEKLTHSSNKCKNDYLPRYRQQLWEGKQHLDSETKTKNMYRDCVIKIAKRMEKCKQVDLMEEIASMVVETEGEVNPNFDPEFLASAPAVEFDTFSRDSGMSDDDDSSDDSSYSSSSSEDSY